jgi:hypothetical protein
LTEEKERACREATTDGQSPPVVLMLGRFAEPNGQNICYGAVLVNKKVSWYWGNFVKKRTVRMSIDK